MTIFATTAGISKASLRLLRAHPRLMAFPALGFAASLTVLLTFLPDLEEPGDGIMLALVYFLVHGIMVFCSAGLVCEALRALRGQPISVSGGLGAAAARASALAAYSAIECTIGMFLSALGRRGRAARWLAEWVLGGAWSLVSYLALPVLMAERRGGYDSLRRSGELLRRIWGETALSEFGFRTLVIHVGIALLLVCLLIARLIDGPVAVVVGIVLVLAFAVIAASLQAIYRAALYIFAAEGVVPDEFDTPDMHAVWRVK
jgi:Family of unknown function (DUF6159)